MAQCGKCQYCNRMILPWDCRYSIRSVIHRSRIVAQEFLRAGGILPVKVVTDVDEEGDQRGESCCTTWHRYCIHRRQHGWVGPDEESADQPDDGGGVRRGCCRPALGWSSCVQL